MLLSMCHQLFLYETWICDFSCDREAGVKRKYGDILQYPTVWLVYTARSSTEERSACMETMNYQSASMAERLIHSETASQGRGKITESIDTISFGGIIPKSLLLLALRAPSFFLPPTLFHPPQHKKISPSILHSPCTLQRARPCSQLHFWATERIAGHLADSYARKTQQIHFHPSSSSLFPGCTTVSCFLFAGSAALTSK